LALDWARLMVFLFFGNGDQGLTEFVLTDIGRVHFEDYPVDPGGRLFQAREDVDFLLALQGLRGAFEAAGDPEALGRVTAALLATSPRPGVRQQRRFHRLLNDLGREWERRGDPDRALDCYALGRLPPARERAVRILAGRGRRRAAVERAAEMAAVPWDVGEERFAERFLFRPDPPRCRLWEVKGPGDVLRPEQERWLRHFNRAGIDARVAHVEWVNRASGSAG
jgi:hypothetical protein